MPPTHQLDQPAVRLFDDYFDTVTELAVAWLALQEDEPELEAIFRLLAWTHVDKNLRAGHPHGHRRN